MNEIIKTEEIFGKVMHVYGTPNDPLFVAADVAAWIGHSNPTWLLKMVDPEEKLTLEVLRAGQRRSVSALTEFGLYEVLLQSTKPIAKAFKKEVKRILHELRTTGYVTAANITKSQLAEMIIDSEKKLAVAEGQLSLQQPAADFYDKHVIKSEHLMPISIIAKEYDTGARTFNKVLKVAGIIYNVGGVWVLKAPYDDLGYAEHKIYETGLGTSRHLYWTEKGFEFIRSKIKA